MPSIVNGLEARDVYLQDQHSHNITMLLHRDLASVTLSAAAPVSSKTVTLIAEHGASAGELLYFFEGDKFTETIITNVNVNTITLDRPIDSAYTTAATLSRASHLMNVNGSVTAVTFHAVPPQNVEWDVMSVRIVITDEVVMDDAKFGGITALTNGVLLRMVEPGGKYHNVGLAKSNQDLSALCSVEYSAKAPAGTYGMSAKCSLRNESGVTLRIRPDTEIQVIIQDDLTALSSVRGVVIGHLVI